MNATGYKQNISDTSSLYINTLTGVTMNVCRIAHSPNNATDFSNTGILPLLYTRNLLLVISGSIFTSVDVSITAYRRLGTNH